MRLSEIGEFGLINILTEKSIFNPAQVVKGVGDDAAVIRVDGSKLMLITTDMMVEDIHFSLTNSTFEQVGGKALMVNISDIAAMGGLPTQAVISLAVPAHLQVEKLIELYHGLTTVAEEFGVNIVGGDTVSSPQKLVINVALTGEVEENKVIYRSGAKPGDVVLVTGDLGRPAAGLLLFNKPEARDFLEQSGVEILKKAHTSPQARLKESRLLGSVGGLSALNDLSDGLASEINEICQASKVGCRLWLDQIPISPWVSQLARGVSHNPLDWALFGGEDFELVFTATPDRAKELVMLGEQQGFPVRVIGEIIQEATAPRVWGVQTGLKDVPVLPKGYNHFK